MTEIGNRKPSRVVEDIHQVTWMVQMRKTGIPLTEPHYLKRQLTEQTLEVFRTHLIKKDADALFALGYWISAVDPSDHIATIQEYLGILKKTHTDYRQLSDHLQRHLWSYQSDPEALIGAQRCQEAGIKLSYATGIKECCAVLMRNKMDESGLTRFADQQYFAFLTASENMPRSRELWWADQPINSGVTKLAVLGGFKILEGEVPFLVEDVDEISDLVNGELGTVTLNPYSWAEARKKDNDLTESKNLLYPNHFAHSF